MKKTFILPLIAVLSFGSSAVAQSPYGQERARAVGEMTGPSILSELQEKGKVSVSGGFFAFDSVELTETSPEVLFRLANAMHLIPDTKISIVGHTDATGDFQYNLELSEHRAEAVRDALIGEPYNVEPERLVVMGAGPIAPVMSNVSEEGQAMNRRIDFVILNPTITH
jgi:outer membrane protein OmpA-like peptidoglycan-associated protein